MSAELMYAGPDMSSFPQVLVSIFDKLVLGAVLVGLGYWLNRRMEKFKVGEQFRVEQLKERNRRLDDILAVMFDFDTAADELVTAGGKFLENHKTGGWRRLLAGGGEIRPAGERLAATEALLRRKVETGGAWLGDRLCDLCIRYLDADRRSSGKASSNRASTAVAVPANSRRPPRRWSKTMTFTGSFRRRRRGRRAAPPPSSWQLRLDGRTERWSSRSHDLRAAGRSRCPRRRRAGD